MFNCGICGILVEKGPALTKREKDPKTKRIMGQLLVCKKCYAK